ncbi:MAG: hypothetical protein KJN64_12230 [Ignavibacteria bacterium]|nr:hypothetical protein [Ignavibacteria bacterium]MBT8384025.1 hypothetical protein [Ignavibacteria bacterium]NNJ52509.1 hypothetical protein [Ignavibacteriaceae bacterium]NNL21783.1 hypothetical protein [Ignavibacteriaceae bacterium]
MEFRDQLNARNVKVQTYIEKKIMRTGNIIATEEGKDREILAGNGINAKTTTGFLFCPRCGLRKPKDKGSKYCPNCGSKMIEEGPLPYVPRSTMNKKDEHKNRIKEGNVMNRSDSIYGLMQQNKFNKNKNGLSSISAVEKADIGEYENAIDEFTEIISLNPKDANSYFARATVKVKIGDIEGARLDFKMSEMCHRTSNLGFENYPLV